MTYRQYKFTRTEVEQEENYDVIVLPGCVGRGKVVLMKFENIAKTITKQALILWQNTQYTFQ